MNEPIEVRRVRLSKFLEEMSWGPEDLAALIKERRITLGVSGVSSEEVEIFDELTDVLNGRKLLSAQIGAELSCYFNRPATDFLGSALNGEAAVIARVKNELAKSDTPVATREVQKAQAGMTTPLPAPLPAPRPLEPNSDDLSWSIRVLRSRALTRTLEQSGKKIKDLATARGFPLGHKDRSKYMAMIRGCLDGLRTLSDEEIVLLAPVLGVDQSVLRVRDFTESERLLRDRLDKARAKQASEPRKKRKVAAEVRKPVAEAPAARSKVGRPKGPGKLNLSLHLEPEDLVDALTDKKRRPSIRIVGNNAVIRIRLTKTILARAMNRFLEE